MNSQMIKDKKRYVNFKNTKKLQKCLNSSLIEINQNYDI